MTGERRSCIDCGTKGCDGKNGRRPDFCLTDNLPEGLLDKSLESYRDGEDGRILRVAATVEHDGYLKWCRVQETMEFARRMTDSRCSEPAARRAWSARPTSASTPCAARSARTPATRCFRRRS